MLVKQIETLEKRDGPTVSTSFNVDGVESQDDGVDGADYYIQGLPWCIFTRKTEKTDTEPTLGIHLYLRKTDDTADIKSCQASRRLTLINIKDKQQSVNDYTSNS
ncbi:hypothetical protein SNE40_000175 [Patella caerulea]|uniref:Uncharacterized protein n=1 Tax=Patella caerulea TaxID=87958 RepID=A0AAN8K9Z6_PATCE